MLIKQTLTCATLTLCVIHGASAMNKDDWTLAKEADGIKVYLRQRPDSALDEFRGEITLNASTRHIVQVLRDANAFRQWMPDVVVSALLKSTQTEQYHYLENRTPWPITNRDGVYHFSYSQPNGEPEGTTLIKVEACPDCLPQRSGKVRIPQADGQWLIKPVQKGVQVTYQMHAAPGGSLPDWLANQAVVDTPYNTLKALRTYLQPHHQDE